MFPKLISDHNDEFDPCAEKKNKFWGLHNEQSKLRKEEKITKNYF